MLTDIIAIGNKLEIKSNSVKNISYLSQIEDIKDEKFIRISAPIHEGKIVPLSIEGQYEILVLAGVSCYLCKGVVKKRARENNLYYMVIEIVSDLKKFQRRNFFRFKCLLKMKYIILPNGENQSSINSISYDENNSELEIYDGIIKDISGGGIRFISNTGIEKGSNIQSFFDLEDNNINIISKLIGVNTNNNELYKFEYQAKFIKISDEHRENVVKYIFDAQRKLLQKEKGM